MNAKEKQIAGLKRLYAHIERAADAGSDRDARWNMMMGALEGAICFQKGMGAVHSLSHALGALGHHHGTLNAILLPHVLAHNADWLRAKLPVMCEAMGLPAGAGLLAFGVSESVFPAMAEASLADNAHKTNPRALTHDDYMALLLAAR